MERMNKEELVKLIESLGIDTEEYWILSSSALVLRDLFPDAGDLDIAVTKKGLEELKSKYQLIDKGNNWYTVSVDLCQVFRHIFVDIFKFIPISFMTSRNILVNYK